MKFGLHKDHGLVVVGNTNENERLVMTDIALYPSDLQKLLTLFPPSESMRRLIARGVLATFNPLDVAAGTVLNRPGKIYQVRASNQNEWTLEYNPRGCCAWVLLVVAQQGVVRKYDHLHAV